MAEAVHCPHITQLCDLESMNGDANGQTDKKTNKQINDTENIFLHLLDNFQYGITLLGSIHISLDFALLTPGIFLIQVTSAEIILSSFEGIWYYDLLCQGGNRGQILSI